MKSIELTHGSRTSSRECRAASCAAKRPPRRLLLCAAVLAAAGCSRMQEPAADSPSASSAADVAAVAPVSGAGIGVAAPDFTALVRQVGPAVVNVSTSQTLQAAAWPSQRDSADPLFEFFRRFLPPEAGEREFRRRGVGSGFVIDTEGYVLTNAHVVAEADEVLVRLADSRREFKARVVGSDRRTDVALLKIDAGDLPVARMGDAQQLQPGEWVAAIGSPFGFANTITAGIVSAKERSLPDESFVPFIQTDVAVNPGNSGGPLLNLRGEVVGINSQIYSRTGGYMGVSFAIPIDVAMDVAKQLRAQGHVTRGRLGIGIQEVSDALARAFRLDQARGALVTAVEPGSPAQRGGLRAGDIITGFGGEPVAVETLPRRVARTKPGTTVRVEVWREGASRTLDVTVGEAGDGGSPRPAAGASAPLAPAAGRLGLGVSELPAADRRALGVEFGLVVERVEGVNAAAPLRRGDVIVAINDQRFTSLADFNRRVAEVPAGGSVALLVRRGEASLYVPLTVAA